jgi:hypothetical protein
MIRLLSQNTYNIIAQENKAVLKPSVIRESNISHMCEHGRQIEENTVRNSYLLTDDDFRYPLIDSLNFKKNNKIIWLKRSCYAGGLLFIAVFFIYFFINTLK